MSACLTDISCWMKDHHLQLNLAMAELLVVPANPSFNHNFTIQLGTSTITPSKTARNLGVMIDDQLISQTTLLKLPVLQICFIQYQEDQALSFGTCYTTRLSSCSVQAGLLQCILLAGLTASSIRPLQLIQNAAARFIFNEPKRMHVTPLFINLHWLPKAAHIKFKELMFAYKTTSGSEPLYLNSLLQTYVPSRSLRSASESHSIVPSQKGTKSLSQTFKLNVPSWWNHLPNSIRAAESLAIFKNRLKTHLFHRYLTL